MRMHANERRTSRVRPCAAEASAPKHSGTGAGEDGTETVRKKLAALQRAARRKLADSGQHPAEWYRQPEKEMEGEHILVCLSSAPSNAKIIRSASKMAAAFGGRFTALFVETPDFSAQTEEDKRRLEENRRLAKRLGASLETVYGDDVPYQIAEFARLSGVTKIVLGRSAARRKLFWGRPALTEQLIAYAPETDIYIIPDQNADSSYRPKTLKERRKADVAKNILKSGLILAAVTVLSLLLERIGFTDANIIMMYILGTVLTSVITSHWSYSLVSSAAGVFIFNYLFTTPRFSLTAYGTGYPVTFVVMFLTAFITGSLALRYKEQALQSARIAHRTKILFDTNQILAKAENREEIFAASAVQIGKLTGCDVVMFDGSGGKLSPPRLFNAPEDGGMRYDEEKDRRLVAWVFENNHAAGATTEKFSDSEYLYLALRVGERVYGVTGIRVGSVPLDASTNGILLSILGECALALENEKNAREKEEAAVLAESEQLRANLLRTISHDLRTPLTSIYGSAGILLNNEKGLDEESRRGLYLDIYNDAVWLIDLVENLLYATRIEEGRMKLRTSAELLSDIIDEAVRHIGRKAQGRRLTVEYEDELLLVKADGRLVEQVVVNLVDNALKYTDPESDVSIFARKAGGMAEVRIADHGPGIPDKEKEKIFDKFYCGQHKIADNRRSLGLGLFLCKAIVEAHGGTIHVEDQEPHGAVFVFTLPLGEVVLHE